MFALHQNILKHNPSSCGLLFVQGVGRALETKIPNSHFKWTKRCKNADGVVSLSTVNPGLERW